VCKHVNSLDEQFTRLARLTMLQNEVVKTADIEKEFFFNLRVFIKE